MNRRMKNRASLLAFTLIALAAMFMSHVSLFAQTRKDSSQLSISPGEIYVIDGRASLAENGRLQCGHGSPVAMGKFANPNGGGATGQTVKLDLSFGVVPFQTRPPVAFDMFSRNESYLGSFAVRNIYPAEPSRPETVASIYFDGTITWGSVSPMRGGVTGFDLLGVTNFSSGVCGEEVDYKTNRYARRYIRLTGTCGIDQEVSFQLSRRPPVGESGDVDLQATDIFASGTFRGNISCGRTVDRSRIRTNLTTAR